MDARRVSTTNKEDRIRVSSKILPSNRKASTNVEAFLLPFLGLSLGLLPLFRNSINPDGIAYLRIAAYYWQGDLYAALNSHWSPLLSWLLLPLYAVHIPWLIAFRILNMLIACACLRKLYQIVNISFGNLSQLARISLLVAMAAQLLVLEFHVVTPDLLQLCLLLYLLYAFLEDTILTRPIQTGILGALLFFSKAYGFYFFIGSVGLYLLALGWKNHFRTFPKNSLLKLALPFFLLCAAWVIALYPKYKKIQLSSAPAYNYAMMDSSGKIHHPSNEFHKMLELPYPRAYCSWEDPQIVYHYYPQEKVARKKISVYFHLVGVNLKNIAALVRRLYPLLFLVLPCLLWLAIRQRVRLQAAYWKLIFFIALYCSGYLPILVVDRYVYLLLFSLMILLYACVDMLLQKAPGALRKGLLTLITLYFMATAVKMLVFMAGTRTDRDREWAVFQDVGRMIPAGTHFATYYTRDLWGLAFQYDLHDLGGIAGYTHWTELAKDLQKYGVSRLIITDSSNFVRLPPEIAGHFFKTAEEDGIQVYSIH